MARLVDASIEQDLAAIVDDKAGLEQQFQEALDARGIVAGLRTKPHIRIEEASNARRYLIAGFLALMSEMGVSAWMFGNRGMSPSVGAVFAFVITLMLERAVHFAVAGTDGGIRLSLLKT